MQQLKHTLKWLKRYVKECNRVLKVTKKPTPVEFKTIVKVSAVAILLIGFVGFLILFVKEMIVGAGI